MARFHYSMQSILNIKLKMESQAKQEFSAARANLDKENECLAALVHRKEAYEREAADLLSGILNVKAIEENKMAVLCMEDYISKQQLKVDQAEQLLEEARERLTQVMVERKTHETLREKAFEQFLQEEKKNEGKEVDELTSYTYGQKKKDL